MHVYVAVFTCKVFYMKKKNRKMFKVHVMLRCGFISLGAQILGKVM